MEKVTGQDIVDFMAEGIESSVKAHLRESLVKRLVSEFEDEITHIIDDKLAEIVFNAYSQENQQVMRKELVLLIEWAKTKKEYKVKYSLQKEFVES